MYIWCTLLHHNLDDFYMVTPRFLFEQYDIYLKMNGLEKSEEKPKEQMYVEDLF